MSRIEQRQESVLCKKDYLVGEDLRFKKGEIYQSVFITSDKSLFLSEECIVYKTQNFMEYSFPKLTFPKNRIAIMGGSTDRFHIKYTIKNASYKITIICGLPEFSEYFCDTVELRKFKLQKIKSCIL